MLSTHTTSLLQTRGTSRASLLQGLEHDIQDAIIDLWHHPQVAQAALHAGAQSVALHLQLLIALPLVKAQPQNEKQAALHVLCSWLKKHHITYQIGYRPVNQSHTHQFVLTAKLPK